MAPRSFGAAVHRAVAPRPKEPAAAALGRGLQSRAASSLVVETCSLDGGRRHLSKVNESGLVVHREACALLVEGLDRV